MTPDTPFYRSLSFWAATLLTIFAIAPFLGEGYFWGANDARHDVFFILQYNITWDEGVFFPRWSPDWAFGYGYPFFNLVAPAATFLGTFLYRALPLTLESAVEATFILTILLSAWGMWLFVRDWLGERAALVGAVAYVYVPYHLFDMVVRAAMGESLAIALAPFALWAVRRATLRPSPAAVAAAALTYAAIHLSHNFVALLMTPLLLAFVAVLAFGKTRRGQRFSPVQWLRHMLAPGFGLALGLALAAFFVFPALTEFKFVNQSQWYGGYYDFHDHFVYFAQLFDPRWGFGISTPGPDDPVSYQLGLVPFILTVLALWQWLRHPAPDREKWERGFWVVVLLAGIFLSTGLSAFLWDSVPLVDSAQFPWRYLTLSALALSALASTLLAGSTATPPGTALLLAGLLILGSAPFLGVENIPAPPGGATLAGLMEFQRSSDEMTGMTGAASEVAAWSPLADLHMAGIAIDNQVDYALVPQNEILAVDARAHRVDSETVWVHADGPGQRLPFYRQWFPGWTATILDPTTGAELDRFALTEADTRPPFGLLSVPIPPGDHLLRISFEDTPIRRLSETISLIAALALAALLLAQVILRARRSA